MRSIALAGILLLGAASAAVAQSSYSGDAALTYHWVRTNAPPGKDCGCFDLNGGGLSASWEIRPPLSVVAEVGIEHDGNALSSGKALTLTSYMAGLRYNIRQTWMHGAHGPEPFAQVLVGGAHASGPVAGAADGSTALAAHMGGGIDIPVNSRFAVRVIEADYYLTRFANSSSDHQNNLLLSAGVVFRWAR